MWLNRNKQLQVISIAPIKQGYRLATAVLPLFFHRKLVSWLLLTVFIFCLHRRQLEGLEQIPDFSQAIKCLLLREAKQQNED